MLPGQSWKQRHPTGRFDAIVIGSGMGGLSVASALARYGKQRVLVLEQHYRIGGYTHTFTRPGYEWDVGVHYIGQVGEKDALREVFDRLSDGSLRWAPLPDVYDRVFLGDRAYELTRGRARFVERLTEQFPRERQAIERYLAACDEVTRSARTFFLDRALPGWASSTAGALLRRGYLKYADRTTLQVLRELTDDEALIGVLTAQYGDYGLPPGQSSFAIHAAVATHYLEGAYYPVGGASVFARAFAPVIEAAGGALFHSAEVSRILVESGRAVGVRMADGEELRAEVVVSDAGVANTFGRLVPPDHVPEEARALLREVKPSWSWVCLYLGYEQSDAELGLTGTNLWLYPHPRHDESLSRFEADPDAPLPLVFASFPSAKDPSWSQRHPGHATVELVAPFAYRWVERWKDSHWRKRGPEYEAMKERFTKRLLEALHKRLPQLEGRAAHVELSTPLSVQHFAGHPHGELYGLEHTPARFRRSLRPKTAIPGLYLTGSDVASVGVAGALAGGALCAGTLLGLRSLWGVLGDT